LIRKILAQSGADLRQTFAASTLGETLLEPTRIYVKPLLALLRDVPVKGMAHITGGGLTENIPRVLPSNVQARLTGAAWARPPIFEWLQRHGNVADAEMHRVFNCGIGMVTVVGAEHAERALSYLTAAGEQVTSIGTIVARPAGEQATVIV
nr:phosphoribosylformylglycinamidine cyclo-ligase [Betaproteobacteria bacterium]